MSEPKRVHFETIGAKKSAITSEASKTIRLELKLFEPNADSFPQFNFSTLFRVEKKKQKKLTQVNGFSSPFEENDEDVERIAKEFEQKYGNAYAGSGSSIRAMNNTVYDKGTGYDENDDFIDNTDAYDELIPDEVDTDRGGFYINCGALQFKQLANFERPEDAQRMPKPRKRLLSTSSSESNESDSEKTFEKNGKNGHSEKKAKLSVEKEKCTVVKDKVKLKEKLDDVGSDSGKDSVKKEVKTTTVKDMLRAKRDSMRNIIDVNGIKSAGQTPAATTTEDSSSSDDSSNSSDDEENDDDEIDDDEQKSNQGNEKDERKDDVAAKTEMEINDNKNNGQTNGTEVQKTDLSADTKLPDNLPADLLAKIQSMKDISNSKSSKNNFFDPITMELLYEIDKSARNCGALVRQQIYKHLGAHLPCTKQTITNKIKKIRILKEDQKLRPLQLKLQKSINEIMPNVIAKYEAECKKNTELRALASAAVANKALDKPEQQYRNPRKKFPWNDPIRNMVHELITMRKQSYAVIKPRNKTIEEFLTNYITDELVALWPKNWMKSDELQKECQKGVNKKPKENKKPADNVNIGSPAVHTATVPMTVAKEFKLTATIVSSNNNNVVKPKTNEIFVEKTANHVTITKTEKKLTDITSKVTGAPTASSTYTNSMTITPTDLAATISKTLPSNPNKVTVTCIERPIEPAHSNTTSSATMKSKTKSITNISNGNVPVISLNPHNENSISRENNSSPNKRASDHSINHIISLSQSSNESSPIKNSDTALVILDSPVQSHSVDTVSNTHNANANANAVDSLKSKNENSIKPKPPIQLSFSNSRDLKTDLQTMSVDSLPKSIKSKKKKATETIHINDTSSSDEVEIVGSIDIDVDRLKKKLLKINTNKYKKLTKVGGSGNSNNSSNSSTTIPKPQTSLLKASQKLVGRDPLADANGDDEEFDVNKIVNDIKFIEEMSTNSSHKHFVSKQSDNSLYNERRNNSRTSSPSYNTKLNHFS